MSNLLKVGQNIDVERIFKDVEGYKKNGFRQMIVGTPHEDVEEITLRFNDIVAWAHSDPVDNHECICYDDWYRLDEVRRFVLTAAADLNCTRIGRVFISKLPPGGKVLPHKDLDGLNGIETERYYDRFHLVYKSEPGNIFRCGDEKVYMKPGELWWFDNFEEHEVINNSSSDRIHLIMDFKIH